MSRENLTVEYKRRIESFLEKSGQIPKVGPANTNHIDNPDLWKNDEIYKGELSLNVEDGRMFSSNGGEIFEPNTDDAILGGMQVTQPQESYSGGTPRWLTVSSGQIRVNGVTYTHTSSGTDGDIQVQPNPYGNQGRYDYVYAYGDFINNTVGLQVVNGSYSIKEILENTIDGPRNGIFLAIVWVPPKYDDTSQHQLRPWSWSVHAPDSDEFSIWNDIYLNNLINAQAFPLPNITPAKLVQILTSTYHYFEDNVELRFQKTLMKDQMVLSGNTLYKVLVTHYNDDIDYAVSAQWLVILTGDGSGGSPGESCVPEVLTYLWESGDDPTLENRVTFAGNITSSSAIFVNGALADRLEYTLESIPPNTVYFPGGLQYNDRITAFCTGGGTSTSPGGDTYTTAVEIQTGNPSDGAMVFTRNDATQYSTDMKVMAGLGLTTDDEGKYRVDTEDTDLVDPYLDTSYTITKQGGAPYAPPVTPTNNLCNVARGTSVDYESAFYYNIGFEEVAPTTVTGDYGNTIPADGVNSSPPITAIVTSDDLRSVSFKRSQSGLFVEGNKVVIGSGIEVKTASLDINFKENIHIGGIDHVLANDSELNAVVDSALYLSSSNEVRRTDIDPGPGLYLYTCFPVTFGEITDILLNDSQSLGAGIVVFEGIRTLTNDGNVGVNCRVYRSATRDPGNGMTSLTYIF